MANPLYQMMGGNNAQFPIIQQFRKFQNSFQGDPRAQVQQLLNSGRISQTDYNRAVQMANQLQRMMGK